LLPKLVQTRFVILSLESRSRHIVAIYRGLYRGRHIGAYMRAVYILAIFKRGHIF
jgi:hypothetical protein